MKKILSLLMALCCYCISANALSITTNPAQVCLGSTLTMTTDGTGGTWKSSYATTASINSTTGVVVGLQAGTVIITYTTPTASATTVLTVSTPGGIGNTSTNGVKGANIFTCTRLGVQMWASTPMSGSTWSVGDASIATIDATTGVATGIVAGTTTITYTYPWGCSSTGILTVKQGPDPFTGTMSVCAGATTTLTSAYNGTGSYWSSSNTAVASVASIGTDPTPTVKITGVGAGTATITHTNNVAFTSNSYCYVTTIVTVGAVITGSGSVCVGSSTALSATPAGGTWISSSGNATVNSTTGVVTGVSVGTAKITYTSGTGCLAVTTMTVNNATTPITGTASVCTGGTTTLSNATGGGTWSSSNLAIATVDPSGVVTGITTGTTTITYAVSAGCYATVDVTVNASPSITGSSSVDYGSQITVIGSPTGGTWSSSATTIATIGTSGALNGVVTGAAAGTCTITYSLASGCYTTVQLTVNPAISGPSLHVCIGGTGTLSASPVDGTWSGGDATLMTMTSLGSQVAITGVAAGTATITYTYSGGIVTAEVTVNPMPVLTGVTTACLGSTITISVLNGSDDYFTGTIHTGNPRNSIGLASFSSSTIVLETGNSPGTDTLWYRAWGTNACKTQIDVTVTKNTSLDLPDNTPLCVGTTITLSSGSTPDGTWQIPAAPQYTVQVSYDASSGVVTGLSTYPGFTVVPVWYFFTPTCMGYTEIIMEDCGPKQAPNAGNSTNAIEYSIAPNPSDGQIVISRSETCTQPVSIKVVSMVGATIYEKQHSFATGSCELSLSNVPGGMYIVELKDANGDLTAQKIVIQR